MITLLRSLLIVGLVWITSSQARAVTIVSSTHPNSVFYDFSSDTIPFPPYSPEGGVPSGARFAIEDGALTINNAYAGSFGVDTKLKTFDAEQLGHVFFDYRLSPEVKVNIFFRTKTKYHGVIFSGPEQVRPGSVLLGKIEGVEADGRWHRAYIPLRDWLRKVYPAEDQLPVDSVIIGNWDNRNYLMAGIGGNGPGAQWSLDNFAVVGAGPGEAKFELRNDKGEPLADAQGFKWSLDGKEIPATGATATVSAADGLHVVDVRDKDGKPAASYAFRVTSAAPQVGAATLQGNTLTVPIAASAGVDTRTLKLTVADRAFDATSPYRFWDGAAGTLNLDAAAAGFQWKDGEKVALTVDGVKDTLGRKLDAVTQTLTIDYAKHQITPPEPAVSVAEITNPAPAALRPTTPPGTGTFEQSLDEWGPRGDVGAAIVERDATTAASGQYSVRLTCPANAAPFRATIRRSPFDATNYPVISFDYKVSPQLRVDFMLDFEGKTYSIQFTDKDNPAPRLGAVENVIADNKWHHAEINLGAMLRAKRPDAPSYRVENLSVGDAGWLGNARSLQYWIDNFQFVPLTSGNPFKASVQLTDVTGVKATAWTLDAKPDTIPPTTANGTSVIETTASGRQWLHVRAQSGAGQWSSAAHIPVWLNTGPPRVGQATPPAEARVAPARLEIPVITDGGIVPASVQLTVHGTQYTLSDAAIATVREDRRRRDLGARVANDASVNATPAAALTLDEANKRLVWDVPAALESGTLQPLPDGTRVEWRLQPLRDYLGHSSGEASGAWIVDYQQDKEPPVVRLTSSSHAQLYFEDFEGPSETWRALEGATVDQVERTEPARPGDRSLRITNIAAEGAFAVTFRLHGWEIARYNLVSFDYRTPPQANVAVRLRFSNGVVQYLQFNGTVPDGTLGTVAGVVADGKWHTAQINLAPFIAKDQRLAQAQLIGFDFLDPAKKTPADISWEIDNFLIQQSTPGTVKLNWIARDLTGVAKYRFAWDQAPTTAPLEEITTTERAIESKPGLWFAHVQAQDGAGNWGPVAHLPVAVG